MVRRKASNPTQLCAKDRASIERDFYKGSSVVLQNAAPKDEVEGPPKKRQRRNEKQLEKEDALNSGIAALPPYRLQVVHNSAVDPNQVFGCFMRAPVLMPSGLSHKILMECQSLVFYFYPESERESRLVLLVKNEYPRKNLWLEVNYCSTAPPGHMVISQLNHPFFIATLDDVTIKESKTADYLSPDIPVDLNLCILLRKSAVLHNLQYPASYPKLLNEDCRRRLSTLVHSLSKYEIPCIANDPLIDEEDGEEEANFELKEVESLLREVRHKHMALMESYCGGSNPQHPRLNHSLREYQCEAVRWMMFKESQEYVAEDLYKSMYFDFELFDGRKTWYSPYHCYFVDEKPKLSPSYRGGILSDEMGLGKTLEIMSLILCNPCPSWCPALPQEGTRLLPLSSNAETPLECTCGSQIDDERRLWRRVVCTLCGGVQHAACVGYDATNPHQGAYMCPRCLNHLIQSDDWEPYVGKATLVVTPETISEQWRDEVCKHIKNVRVLDSKKSFELKEGFDDTFTIMIYHGVQQRRYVQPCVLAGCDMVLTTYSVLQRDLNHIALGCTKESLRSPLQRFMAKPSPLMGVHWWRVCLDEAQLATNKCDSKAAAMAKCLSSANRWCVTGTPISASLSDLQRFLGILSIDPFWVPQWWEHLVVSPFRAALLRKDAAEKRNALRPLVALLSRYIWRTHKSDVLDQINLKEHREEKHFVDFPTIERYFYSKRVEEARRALMAVERQLGLEASAPLDTLPAATKKLALSKLERVRQACSHPSVLQNHLFRFQRKVRTKADVLEQLQKENANCMKEAFRSYQLSMNGTAGLQILQSQFNEAAETYRELLFEIRKEKDNIEADELQQIHVLVNFKWLLTAHEHCIEGRSVQEDNLMEEIRAVHKKYSLKNLKQAASAISDWHQHQERLKEAVAAKTVQEWLQWALLEVHDKGELQTLLDSVDADCPFLSCSLGSAIRVKTQAHQIILSLSQHLDNMERLHERALRQLRQLNIEDSVESSTITAAGTISAPAYVDEFYHCCAAKHRLTTAKPTDLTAEQRCAFCRCEAVLDKLEKAVFANERSLLLRFVNNVMRIVARGQSDVTVMNNVRQRLEALRTSYYVFSKLLCERRMLAGTFDELNQAVKRYTTSADDRLGLVTASNFIDSAEALRSRLLLHSQTAEAAMQNYEGLKVHMRFFKNQEDERAVDRGPREETEFCPICLSTMKACIVSFLPCGHSVCYPCFGQLVVRRSGQKCPTCRTHFSIDNVRFAILKVEAEGEEEGETYDVQGDHCSKVCGIVQCLKRIQAGEPGAKALVFSIWPRVLEVVQQALLENGIRHAILVGSGKAVRANLSSFRDNDDLTVLLLPLHSGCNGLNLVEANHVLLADPILDPGQEAQAIGRIHRIGQRRATVVHHFLARGTIETTLHDMTRAAAATCSSLQPAPSGSGERCSFSLQQLLHVLK